MNLQRCRILGFGKLSGLELCFHAGLNLVFAANEAGKSTLQQFLLGLLFGPLRDDVPHQRRLEAWVEKFTPWRNAEYGGILWCRLANGRDLEIHRAFGKEDSRAEIRTAGGEDITGSYEHRKNGDVVFAGAHLGMTKDLFESLAVVRENRASDFHGPETIRDRITNLAQTGDEGLSVARSLGQLEQALEELGSDRAPKRPFRLAQERVRAFQEERRMLQARWAEFHEWVQERNRLAQETEDLKRQALDAALQVAAARWKETSGRVRKLEKIEAGLLEVRRGIAELDGYGEVPVDHLDELNRLAGEKSALELRLEEIRAALARTQDQLARLRTEREKLAPFGRLDPDIGPEKLTEWLVGFRSLDDQQKDLERRAGGVEEERGAAGKELERLGPVFGGQVDWQAKVQEANEEERAVNQKYMDLGEEIAAKNAAMDAARRAVTRGRAWGAAGVALALATAGGALILLEPNPGIAAPVYTVALALAIGGALFFMKASRSRRSRERLRREIEELKETRDRVRQEAQKTHFEIGVAMASAGSRSIEEFLSAARRSEQVRSRVLALETSSRDLGGQRDRIASERQRLCEKLKESLESAGLAWSPETLDAQVAGLRENLRHFKTLDQEYQNCLQTEGSLLEDEIRFAEQLKQRGARIQSILSEGKQDSPDSFREACRKHRWLTTLQEKEASLLREYDALSDRRPLEEWRERLKGLGERLPQHLKADEAGPGTEEAEQAERRVAELLAVTREKHARLVERINQAFQNLRTLSEIEEDLAQAEGNLEEIAKNREALNIALQTLTDVSRQQQENLAPQLNRAVEQRFLRLCGARYEEVKIDPDFRICVRESGTGALRSAELLSQGTRDQLYFALRFGILDLVSNSAEPCPCLLDEPFAAYDRLRLEEAFKILEEESQRRQLLIFTCREDLRDLARAHSAHLVELPL